MEKFGSICMVRMVYVVSCYSGFEGKRVIGNFLLKVLYARLVLDDDWIDVENWAKEGV